jgi:predicted hydrocarbon binding protein
VNSAATSPTLSNRLVQFFIDCTVEEVGADNLTAILAENQIALGAIERGALLRMDGVESAGLYASLQLALRLFYGHGARGLLLRVGEGMWKRMLAQANFLEKTQLEIVRMLPVPARRRRMLEQVAGYLREAGGLVSVHTLDLDLLLVDHSGAATANQNSREPICFVTLGLIQGALFWAAGQEADLEEIACKATGALACEFKVKLGGK